MAETSNSTGGGGADTVNGTSNSGKSSSHKDVVESVPLLRPLVQTLGRAVVERVVSSRVLLVGSGGIGCELLKNLALSGFRTVDVIDMDTIDVSNLNRQFLFRSHHVGRSKCEVAVEAARAMSVFGADDDGVRYVAHHGNVKDRERFGVSFVRTFDVVLNALDNVDARRHVNRLCLAANVPLIEAGTTGYLGQVTVIHKDSGTECYECQPKPAQKVYPICTIRSTPSMPVHTIVWAKELYKLLFHDGSPQNSMLYEDTDADEESTYMDIVENQIPTKDDATTKTDRSRAVRKYAHDVLVALYNTELQKQIGMDRYKTAKKTPVPLDLDLVRQGTGHNDGESDAALAAIPPPTKSPDYKHTQTWSPVQCVAEFTACLVDAYDRDAATPRPPDFDKDDPLAMRLVTAASNLRSHVFGIEPLQSLYEAKGIAGNIIPAIATTNAIVAGLQVLNVFHILAATQRDEEEKEKKTTTTTDEKEKKLNVKKCCKYVYCLRERTRKGYYLQPTELPSPNPQCFVCRGATIEVTLNCETWTMEDFLSKVLKKRLGFVEPTLMNANGDIIHEEGEGADEQIYAVNLPKTMVNLPGGGVKGTGNDVLSVDDAAQNLEVDVLVLHREEWDEEKEPDGFVVGGNTDAVIQRDASGDDAKSAGDDGKKEEEEEDDDDDVVMVEDDVECLPSLSVAMDANEDAAEQNGRKKRARSEDEEDKVNAQKKMKASKDDGNDSIVID